MKAHEKMKTFYVSLCYGSFVPPLTSVLPFEKKRLIKVDQTFQVENHIFCLSSYVEYQDFRAFLWSIQIWESAIVSHTKNDS